MNCIMKRFYLWLFHLALWGGLHDFGRHPILSCESFYVSAQRSMLTPNTRKVTEVLIKVGNHPIMIYNAHLALIVKINS